MVLNFLAGFAGGWAFYAVWRKILPRTRSRVFWQAMPVHASGMVHCADPDDVMRHYRALMKQVATFAARNTLAVIAGLLPVSALFLLSDALYAKERGATIVEVQPAPAVSGISTAMNAVPNGDGGLLIDRRKIPRHALRLFGETLDSNALASKRAFCSGMLACLGYELMLFKTHRLKSPWLEGDAASVVVRPHVFAGNPFWPQLDDLELAFFAGLIAGGGAIAWRSSRTKGAEP
jgi:hypothetical protein